MTTTPGRMLQPGDQAPSFTLQAVNRDGLVGLDDYRGKSPVLVGLYRGVYCPFCRRQLAQLAITRDKLAREGVETVAIVNTPAERARQYFQYRPTRVLLAADPDVRTHRAFGLPRVGFVADGTDSAELRWPDRTTLAQFLAVRVNPTGELPGPQNIPEASEALNKKDGFELTEGDRQTFEAHGTQLPGQFLIDAQGTIRWSYAEGADRLEDFAKAPSDGEILAAVEAMSR